MSVVLEETINNLRAAYLLECYTFDEFYINWSGTKTDSKKEYENLMKYLVNKLSTSNNYVKYNFAKGRTSGRLFGDFTIQTCVKNVRGFLCDGLTTDIDMDNAHPSILLKLCQTHDIECPNLSMYCQNRKKCLNDIQEKDNLNYFNAKKKVLVSTNMDKRITTKSEFLKNYDKEMKTLHKRFLDIEEYNYVKDYARKDTNFGGSFINHILCINENEILGCMRTFCDINSIKPHSLMFDGLMVYGDINEFTLNEMEKFIKMNTIFDNMKLSIKQHEYDFKIPKEYTPKKIINYQDIKTEFEKHNCKIKAEFVCDGCNDINIYTRRDFGILHEEMIYITDEGKDKEFIERWFKDPDKRKFDKYDCIPKDNMCPDNVYNMWEKLPVEIMPKVEKNEKVEAALNWFQNHIRVMVDYEETHYDFVCKWLSQMFQYPENKSIHLIFVGEEGSGKGTFVKFLTTIMGGGHRAFSCCDPQEDIFGKFNDCMKRAFLVIMNEADKSGVFNNNKKLKDYITEPTINIRPKGRTAFTMKSVHRFMSFSNSPDPNIKNKRRDFTMRTSSNKVIDKNRPDYEDNKKYFNEGNLYANDITCCKYIYDYFMQQKTNPNIVSSDIPTGEYDDMLKEAQKDNMLEFLEELTYIYLDRKEPKDYISVSLYELFIDFCKRNHIEYVSSKMSFTTKLSFKKFDGITKSIKWYDGKTANVWTIDFQILQKTLKVSRLKIKEELVESDIDSD